MFEEKSITPDVLALIRSGYQARSNRRFAESHSYFSKAIEKAQVSNSIPTIAYATLALADNALWYLPDALGEPWEYRRSMCEKALSMFESVGEYRGICRAKCMLAAIEPDIERASRFCQEAIELATENTDSWAIAIATLAKGHVYAMRGQKRQATPFLCEALQIARQLNDDSLLIQTIASCILSCDSSMSDSQFLWAELFKLLEHQERWADLAHWHTAYIALCCENSAGDAEEHMVKAIAAAKRIGAKDLVNQAFVAKEKVTERKF